MANPTFTTGTTVNTKGKTSSEIESLWSVKFQINKPSEAARFFSNIEQFILRSEDLNEWIENREKSDLVNLIDVRKTEDYKKGHLPGATNLPIDQWEAASDLKKDKMNVIYCYSIDCPLAWHAAKTWAEKGFPVMVLLGGFDRWKEADFKIDTKVHH